MDSDAGGWLWLIVDVVLVAALAVGLIYGTMMWRARRRNPVLEQARDEATERLYKSEDPEDHRKTAV